MSLYASQGFIQKLPRSPVPMPSPAPHAGHHEPDPVLVLPAQPPVLSAIERSKQLAAHSAVDEFVTPNMKIIGIGSGSTVPYVVERIVAQGADANRDRIFVPTGFQSKALILNSKLNLGDVEQFGDIDVTIDGADEVDSIERGLNCIKGGGACQLREKVLAEAAKTWVVVADHRKNSDVLGTNFKPGVPIEVVPFAYLQVLSRLHHMGSPDAKLRMAVAKAGPVVSDNGMFIIDAPFPPEKLEDPAKLLHEIKLITGVVEVGLFCKMARACYFGNEDGTVTVKWNDGRVQKIDADRTP
ncbi:ribose 5-phosphate isomerase A-domain-containing protein [Schizophyllum commune]|nr:ribose 5-phosphate isomerase [Schizophyllum commune Loenen D]KAI5823629.1 ribose 5-phosphate isomerase [Schizophyllum commune Tattone D]